MKRISALREITIKIAEASMREEAKKVFERVIEVAERIMNAQLRSEVLRKIATEIVRAKKFEQVMEVARRIEDAWLRSRVLREIAAEMAKEGMREEAKEVFERAIEVAGRIENAGERLWVLREIAAEMMKAGMIEEAKEVFEQAIEVAGRIEEAWWRFEALGQIAAEMMKARIKDRAEEVLNQAWEAAQDAISIQWLWEIAEIADRLGLHHHAVEFAKQIAGEKEKGLPKVLEALTEAGAKDEFKLLLPLCGWAMVAALVACMCLIRLYLYHALSIAETVQATIT